MQKLVRDAGAASNAQYWASTCPYPYASDFRNPDDGTFLPDARKTPQYSHGCSQSTVVGGYGQAWDISDMGRVSWTSAVAAWYSEIYYFSGCDAPYNNINLTWDTYTQVMWADTAAIGCGQAMCNNYIISPGSAGYTPEVKLYVCNYCPGENRKVCFVCT
ncbi:cysteine-rich secretory protein 2-like [Paramacrobiotus metropolitanus]|uniref:cysteine-rich secretory protein 2-like n=1 Tax=Paramacrobiotus metropolitanus TaxID=2943436 RepID=UPI002445618B|nr:cysteine-rich secretory protein 2-like [Paramacrobiotus metropolitanus]